MKAGKSIMKTFLQFLLPLSVISTVASGSSTADISIISNPARSRSYTEQEVRSLYLGTKRFEQVELIDQGPGAAKNEFYDRFLGKTETQMKQQWSVLVFSGNRAPLVLTDDQAVLDYVLHHPKTLGYVSSSFLKEWKSKQTAPSDLLLFTVP